MRDGVSLRAGTRAKTLTVDIELQLEGTCSCVCVCGGSGEGLEGGGCRCVSAYMRTRPLLPHTLTRAGSWCCAVREFLHCADFPWIFCQTTISAGVVFISFLLLLLMTVSNTVVLLRNLPWL